MIRFGIIGAGNIAHTFAEALAATSGHRYAVASRDLNKAKTFKQTHGFDKAYGSYQALFEDEQVDCVYIATPHGYHYDHMMAALDYNKPILCEKAFTLNAKQAKAVFAKAKAKGIFVMEAMWTRFLPTIQAVQSTIKNGIIGEVETLTANFHFNPEQDHAHRLFNPILGGGALLDIGIYPLTLANLMLGEPQTLTSTVTKYETGIDLEETITYKTSTVTAHLSASLAKPVNRDAEITGTKGTIKIPGFWAAEHAHIYDLNGQHLNTIENPHPVNGFEYQINHVIECLKNGLTESPIMPAKTTIAMLKHMDDLRQSWGITYPQESANH